MMSDEEAMIMRRKQPFRTLIGAAVVPLLLLFPTPTGTPVAAAPSTGGDGPVTLTALAPTAVFDTVGTHVGSVDALATRDQSETADDPSRYVQLEGSGDAYSGYRTYTLPSTVPPSTVTTITLLANFRGPTAAKNAWTWSVYDWTNDSWVRLGTQDHCGGDAGTKKWPCDDLDRTPWKYLRYNVIHAANASLGDFVNGATHEIRIDLEASSAGAAKLDWEAVEVYSNDGAASTPWMPAVGTRWQWQLQGKPGRYEDTGGIDVEVCKPPFGGGPCVRPDVFDFDLYVDPSIAGRYGWTVETAAVDAVHASGQHAIGYMTAGDAERWRPDYEQFVDFDRQCDGCLLGEPFSRRFPDEYWANLNNGKGQFDFMLQMIRARTDKVAAAGFDGVEYDIVDAFAQGKDTTGFRISADTQLAYNIALSEMAHADGLSVALKNDGQQIPDLLPYFDYAINEQCFQYDECAGGGYSAPGWRAFIAAGKPVFQAEYRLEPKDFCRKANRWDFSSIVKARNYSLFALPWTPCR
jgi:endo-alpha-1,4-polygalactosaminidase (GH114 family)